ncbi:TIGR04222 domain-containing membrane protein [Streptomyces physcomitrii]|uniref:TIGR04222 domain-containing membrane protein n=1 Tax=Streptomyces physcomitrii TaxID=2724184 RepID=A0ABX1H810_9ACTN|nr:TIGR04222 domain-containing membrane protein [Streptomyces physcomitrii]NKI44477.1 TIGR04222 domain-containing membrane protein [Streptomyces physcomitrii]
MLWLLFLLLACVAALVSCIRLCLAAVRAAAADAGPGTRRELTLYEAAFLSGGPHRAAELTLVSMAYERRMLLAHTGWATVVDQEARDPMEAAVIEAVGPGGQSPIAEVRTAAAAAPPVRELADALVRAGLAVPESSRGTVAGAVRQVRAVALAVPVLAAAAVLAPGRGAPGGDLLSWFALPLLLSLCSLGIARFETYPYTRWASQAGRRLLAELPSGGRGSGAALTEVALRGTGAAGDPQLRAAFAVRSAAPRTL